MRPASPPRAAPSPSPARGQAALRPAPHGTALRRSPLRYRAAPRGPTTASLRPARDGTGAAGGRKGALPPALRAGVTPRPLPPEARDALTAPPPAPRPRAHQVEGPLHHFHGRRGLRAHGRGSGLLAAPGAPARPGCRRRSSPRPAPVACKHGGGFRHGAATPRERQNLARRGRFPPLPVAPGECGARARLARLTSRPRARAAVLLLGLGVRGAALTLLRAGESGVRPVPSTLNRRLVQLAAWRGEATTCPSVTH